MADQQPPNWTNVTLVCSTGNSGSSGDWLLNVNEWYSLINDPKQQLVHTSREKIMSVMVAGAIDACGLRCPLPLLRAKQGLRDLTTGELLRVSATDSGSVRDFFSFAEISGHRLEAFCEAEGVYIYLFRKK